MIEALEPLLVRHQQAQDMLGLGATKYWQLVRTGQIEVVGAGAMSRAVTHPSRSTWPNAGRSRRREGRMSHAPK